MARRSSQAADSGGGGGGSASARPASGGGAGTSAGNSAEAEPQYGQKHTYDPTFHGPIKKRGCTDVYCCIIFLAFLGAWGYLGYYCWTNGDINRVLHPSNSRGEICGIKEHEGKPYVLMFNLASCASAAQIALTGRCPTQSICIEECPKYFFFAAEMLNPVPAIFEETRRERLNCFPEVDKSKITQLNVMDEYFAAGKCAPIVVPSDPVAGLCLPSPTIVEILRNTSDGLTDSLNATHNASADSRYSPKEATEALGVLVDALDGISTVINFLTQAIQDIQAAIYPILAHAGAALILAFLWLLLLRFLAGTFVWVAIISLTILFTAAAGYSWYRYTQATDGDVSPQVDNIVDQGNLTDDPMRLIDGNWTASDLVDFNSEFNRITNTKDFWLGVGIVASFLLLVILVIAIFMRAKIVLATKLMKETSRALGRMPLAMIWPIAPIIGQAVIFAFFVLVLLFLQSLGNPEYELRYNNDTVSEEEIPDNLTIGDSKLCTRTEWNYTDPESGKWGDPNNAPYPIYEHVANGSITCEFTMFRNDPLILYFQLYNLFGLFWGVFFVVGMSQTILAGGYAGYYWTWDKKHNLPAAPLLFSFGRTSLYHTGSIALGSLLVAIFRIIRFLLNFIWRKVNKFKDKKCCKLILKCLKCCFYCFEKLIRYMTRNAYVMIAVYGKNFCKSAKEAYFLLMRNVTRAVVLSAVVGFCLILGKLIVIGSVGVFSYFYFAGLIDWPWDMPPEMTPKLNYFWIPIIVVVILSYFICNVLFDVYQMGVDTIFLCFLEDLERNDGTKEKPFYMSRGLLLLLGKKNEDPHAPPPRSAAGQRGSGANTPAGGSATAAKR